MDNATRAELPWGFQMRQGGPSPDFPNYIGVESCADMCNDADEVVADADDSGTWLYRRKDKGRRATHYERKEYPPLIPLLARTENLHSHMPWVLMRHYTPDGRLILTEEKVRHHEYFQVHRNNGRLTLQLVTLDDKVLSYPPNRQAKDVSEIPSGSLSPSPLAEGQNEHFGNDVKADGQEEEEEDEGVRKAENGGGGVGCGGSIGLKCLNYKSAGVVGSPSSSSKAGPCIIGMPVPALRQVHGQKRQ